MATGEVTLIAEKHVAKRASLARHTTYYLAGRIASGLVGLLALMAFTRVLNPADYGRYSVILAIAGLIAGTGFQWLRQCLVRFGTGMGTDRQPLLGTLGALFAGQMLVLVALGVGSALFVDRGQWHAGMSAADIAGIWCLAVAQSWFELAADSARTELRPWRYSFAIFLRALLSLVLGVLAALLLHEVAPVVLAMAAAYVLASAATTPRWLEGLLRINLATLDEIKRLCHYGLPLVGTLGLQFILDSADRLMLASMRTFVEVGVYSSAYNLAQFSIGALLSGLGLGALPLAVGAARRSDGSNEVAELLGRNLVLGVGIGLPAVTGLVLLSPTMDRLLLGNYVAGRSDLITMMIAIAVGMAAIRSYCVDVVFMLQKRTWLQALLIGFTALFNVLLNVVLIPRWGAVGAAAATLVAFLFALAGSWLLSRRYLRIPLYTKDMTKIVLGCFVLAIVLAVLPSAEGWLQLAAAIIVGALVYSVVVVALDAAGSRRRLASWFARYKLQG